MGKYTGFIVYMGLCALFLLPIYIAPYIAAGNPSLFHAIQGAYAPACHQLTSRSICYYANGAIGDCTYASLASKEDIVVRDGVVGYKFPVCARDLAIYGAMIVGGLLFPLWKGIDNAQLPRMRYFVIALVPIALDGGTQLLGFRTSTNALRLITGFIAGIVVPFYVLPMLNGLLSGKRA
jgi:uncharacterized membrane protein